MVADRLEVPVVGAAFLLPVYRTLARIHVEHDAVCAVQRLGLSDHVAVHGHQPHEVFFTGQQLGLEPMQRRRQRRTAVLLPYRPSPHNGDDHINHHRADVGVAQEFLERADVVPVLQQVGREAVSE